MTSTAPAVEFVPHRVVSVDALRGFDMFWIIGGGPVVIGFLKLFSDPLPAWLKCQFDHARWEGFTAWDLIMPLFLFLVGAAMPLSLGRRLEEGQSRWRIYRKAILRTALLFILGMAAQGNLLAFDLKKLHLYCNTLQAIGAGYLVSTVALVELSVAGQAFLVFALLVAYWLLMAFVPVLPGDAAGVFTENGNLAFWIDKALLGPFHAGNSYTWILSSLSFAATVLIGVLAGHLLRSPWPGGRKVALLTASGLGCLLAGWLWSDLFPINKHLFTSSMVLWASGWSLLLLALFYGLIEVLGFRRWAFPFVVIGMNAIAVYMAWRLINFNQISDGLFGDLARHAGFLKNLIVPCGALGIVWGILYYMYRKKTFLRI